MCLILSTAIRRYFHKPGASSRDPILTIIRSTTLFNFFFESARNTCGTRYSYGMESGFASYVLVCIEVFVVKIELDALLELYKRTIRTENEIRTGSRLRNKRYDVK